MWWKDKKWKRESRNEMKEWIGNEIGTEGAKTISESLKINTSLTSLNLGCDEEDKKRRRENKMKRNEGMNR